MEEDDGVRPLTIEKCILLFTTGNFFAVLLYYIILLRFPSTYSLVGPEEEALLLGRLTAAPDAVKLPSISPLSIISSISHPIRKYAAYRA